MASNNRFKPAIWLPCLALALLIVAVYYPVVDYDFINFDDYDYVRDNPYVTSGLTGAGIRWALTTNYQDNWFPLTWMSFMLDAEVAQWASDLLDLDFSPGSAGIYHLTNVILHIANTLLLFGFLWKATGSRWRGALAAALFALHPLRVESVAWVVERKDVLSAFFWLSAMWFYLAYVRRPNPKTYAAVAVAFVMGILSKQMVVTLPFVLLALDYWPLGRLKRENVPLYRQSWLVEKLPLFVLALAGWAAAFVVMNILPAMAGSVFLPTRSPLGVGLASVVVSYATYLRHTIVPTGLAVFYPHPGASLPAWIVVVSAAVLAIVTLIALKCSAKRPYIAVGWFWYLIALVPPAGIVFTGQLAGADRFTYIPAIGLCIIAAWLLPEPRARAAKVFLAAALAVVVLVLGWASRVQLGYWRDSVTLFERTLNVTSNNATAHYNLGMAYTENSEPERAMREFEASLRIKPDDARVHCSLGIALAELGRYDEAITSFRSAIAIQPNFEGAVVNMGVALLNSGRTDEAIDVFSKILARNPNNELARYNLEIAQERKTGEQ